MARLLLHTCLELEHVKLDVVERELLARVGVAPDAALPEIGASELASMLENRVETLEGRSLTVPIACRNAQMLANAIGLTPAESEVLAAAIALGTHGDLSQLLQLSPCTSLTTLATRLGQMLCLPTDCVRSAVAPTGQLRQARLLELVKQDDCLSLAPHRGLEDLLTGAYDESNELLRHLFEPVPSPALDLSAFDHFRQDVELLANLLAGALDTNTRGVNVLLYGPPGTGKTELARALVVAARSTALQVPMTDGDGDPCRLRMWRYALAQQLTARAERTVMIFDEAEDVFQWELQQSAGAGPSAARIFVGGSKGWTNRVLEDNASPTIWISNAIGQVDPAHLRRFDYVLRVPRPPRHVALQILEAQTSTLPVREEWIRHASRDPRLTPAQVEAAVRVVTLAGYSDADQVEEYLERVLRTNLEATGARMRPQPRRVPALAFDPALLNTTECPTKLLRALESSEPVAMLFHGQPGTGKTALGHHLAKCLDAHLLVFRASDLLGSYVGETERAIADMFRRGSDERVLLLLDEADSLLRERSSAHRTWEATMVNEMLAQMDTFHGRLICTTNLVDGLDRAVMRRFSIKVGFEPTSSEQRRLLFAETLRALGLDLDPTQRDATLRELDLLSELTPADFAMVVDKATLCGEYETASAVLKALRAEHEAKTGRRPMGFR